MCQAQNSLNASYFLLIHQYLVDGLLWPVWECVYTYKKMNVYTKKKKTKKKKNFFQVLLTTTSFSSVLSCEDLLISSFHRSANM